MRKFLICIYLFTICFVKLLAEVNFGYISYSTYNIGDDIQAIAAKRFLPENIINIDREYINPFKYHSKVFTIINGWYMHTKDIFWYLNKRPPKQSWPPSSSIEPLLISIYFFDKFIPEVLSDENIEYLKRHGPVGARDYYTLNELKKRGVPSYFSGCLTLTLDNPYKEEDRGDIIYLVDLDKECINFIKSRTKCKVKILTHDINPKNFPTNKKRLKYAENILEKYRKAKCVITRRLHASMPCLAFKTPVLLINSKEDNKLDRLSGLRELVWHCSKEELLNGEYYFNFEEPPKNPDNYLELRENLIKIVNDWVECNRDENKIKCEFSIKNGKKKIF